MAERLVNEFNTGFFATLSGPPISAARRAVLLLLAVWLSAFVAGAQERSVDEITDEIEALVLASLEEAGSGSGDAASGPKATVEAWKLLHACSVLRSQLSTPMRDPFSAIELLAPQLVGSDAQQLLAELADAVHREGVERLDAYMAELDSFRKRRSHEIMRAERAVELDPMLVELGRLKGRLSLERSNSKEADRLARLTDQYIDATAAFQDHLVDGKEGNYLEGARDLDDIVRLDWVGPPLLPRAEIQELRTVQNGGFSRQFVDEMAEAILLRVRDLNDLQDAILDLRKIKGSPGGLRQKILESLNRLREAHVASQTEIGTRNHVFRLRSIDFPSLIPLVHELQYRFVEKELGKTAGLEVKAIMSPEEWVQELFEEAILRGEWNDALYKLEIVRKLNLDEIRTSSSLPMACRDLQAGENFERAGVTSLAVYHYLRATRYIPEKISGEITGRLEKLKERHPVDYANVVARMLPSPPDPGSQKTQSRSK